VLIGDKVLAIAEDGKAVSFRAVPSGFEKLSESDVGEAVFATPAIANGKLFIRGANTLFAIGK
jgi:outer membrane protein assembly factor BamB